MQLSSRDYAALQAPGLFSGCLGDEPFAALARRGDWLRSCRGGHVLMRKGSHPGHLVVVLDGAAEMVLSSRNGNEKAIRILRAGECCGLETLFSGAPVPFELRALSPTRFLRLPGAEVLAWAGASALFRQRVLRQLADDTAHLYEELEGIHHNAADQRLACYLHCGERRRRREAAGNELLTVNFGYGKLARRLGTSHPHLSRTLRSLEAAGTIGRDGRQVEVRDPAAFARLLCSHCRRSQHA